MMNRAKRIEGKQIFENIICNYYSIYNDARLSKNGELLKPELEKYDIHVYFNFNSVKIGYERSKMVFSIYKGKKCVFRYAYKDQYCGKTCKLVIGPWLHEAEAAYNAAFAPKPKQPTVEELYANTFCTGKSFCNEAVEIINELGHGVCRTISEDQYGEQSTPCDVYSYGKLSLLKDRDTPLLSITFDEQKVFDNMARIYYPGKWEELVHYLYEKRFEIPEIERREKDFKLKCEKITRNIANKYYYYNINQIGEHMSKQRFYDEELKKRGIRLNQKHTPADNYGCDMGCSSYDKDDYYVYKNDELVFHERESVTYYTNLVFKDGSWVNELEEVLDMSPHYRIVSETNSEADKMLLEMKKRFDNQ